MKTNLFTLEPCKTCGRAEILTSTQMKRELLEWAGIKTSVSYGGSLSKAELAAIYTKVFKEKKGLTSEQQDALDKGTHEVHDGVFQPRQERGYK